MKTLQARLDKLKTSQILFLFDNILEWTLLIPIQRDTENPSKMHVPHCPLLFFHVFVWTMHTYFAWFLFDGFGDLWAKRWWAKIFFLIVLELGPTDVSRDVRIEANVNPGWQAKVKFASFPIVHMHKFITATILFQNIEWDQHFCMDKQFFSAINKYPQYTEASILGTPHIVWDTNNLNQKRNETLLYTHHHL